MLVLYYPIEKLILISQKAKEEMKKAKYTPREVNLVQDIIYWHHKLTNYESDIKDDDTPLTISNAAKNDR